MAVATVDQEGNPHCIAAAFVKVVSVNQVLITNNYMNITPRNIETNHKITLAVWNSDWRNNCIGYEFIGTAEYFISGKWFDLVKKLKENEDRLIKGAVLITIENAKLLA